MTEQADKAASKAVEEAVKTASDAALEVGKILVHVEYIRKAIEDIQTRFVADDARCNVRHHECDGKISDLEKSTVTMQSWFRVAGTVFMALLTGIIAYLVKVR